MTESTDGVFLDNNILVYLVNPQLPEHAAAHKCVGQLAVSHGLFISPQVLRCVPRSYNRQASVVPHPEGGSGRQGTRAAIQFGQADPRSVRSTRCASGECRNCWHPIFDASIVAAVLTHRIPSLLTNNARDFRPFASVFTVLDRRK